MPIDPRQPPQSHQVPRHRDDLDKVPKAETARQEGAQGKPPGSGDAGNGNIDTSDPEMTAGKS